jgi:hypothetical protein
VASQHPPSDASSWVTVGHTNGVEVDVERALFDGAGSKHFFLRVRITNKRGSPLGVDLRKYDEVFYPNQWGASAEPRRTAIDERRLMLPPLDEKAKAALLADYRAGALTRIPPESSLEYYRDFNASDRADVDAQSQGYAYVLVSVDGQLKVTDGVTAERIVPASNTHDVAVDAPVAWRHLPANAIVIQNAP